MKLISTVLSKYRLFIKLLTIMSLIYNTVKSTIAEKIDIYSLSLEDVIQK